MIILDYHDDIVVCNSDSDKDYIYTIGCENGNEHEKRKLSSFIIHLEKEKNENMMPRL